MSDDLQRMKKMNKFKVISIVAAAALLSACNTNVFSPFSKENTPTKQVETAKAEETKKPVQEAPKEEKTKTKEVEPAKPVQTLPVQPGYKPTKGEKLTFDVIDKLDNKSIGWWKKANSLHKTPEFPDKESKLVLKYNGIYIGDTSKKIVYLTFDEGYENGYTPKILDVLKQNNTKAVFFITGDYLKSQPALVKRMLDEGHLVGNHTVKHPHMPGMASAIVEKEILDLEKQFHDKFGKGMKYFRAPYGEYSERTLSIVQQLGYKSVFWSFDYLDWDTTKQKGADNAHKVVMDNLHNGSVMLLHAVSKDNAEALDGIIKDIKAQGYEIRLLDL